MDKPRTSSALLIVAIALLLLPALYIGSYLAIVSPFTYASVLSPPDGPPDFYVGAHYRYGGENAWRFYYPLEKVDRSLRPWLWQLDAETIKRELHEQSASK